MSETRYLSYTPSSSDTYQPSTIVVALHVCTVAFTLCSAPLLSVSSSTPSPPHRHSQCAALSLSLSFSLSVRTMVLYRVQQPFFLLVIISITPISLSYVFYLSHVLGWLYSYGFDNRIPLHWSQRYSPIETFAMHVHRRIIHDLASSPPLRGLLRSLVDDPWHLVKHEVKELLIQDVLILANEVFLGGRLSGAFLDGVRSWA